MKDDQAQAQEADQANEAEREAAQAEAAEAEQAAEAAEPPAPKPEPFDIVRGVEKYIADTVNRAEQEEHGVAGEIISQRNKVARLNIAMLRMEQGKKQIKDRLENEVELLDSMERSADAQARMDHEQPPLPFGEKQAATTDDAWRSVEVAALGLKEHVERKLIEGDVKTLGQLGDWRASNGESPKIAGLGEAARQDIDDAVERYWKEHPRESVGGNGDAKSEAAPEPTADAKPTKKGRGKRAKEATFVDKKDGMPVENGVRKPRLPDAGEVAVSDGTVSEEWANAQRPPMAIAN